jgi:1-deoxy-D-xylulose-5-phosphate synthase
VDDVFVAGEGAPVADPARLRQMPASQLPLLAARVRERLIEVVSQNGGHLAPNLGVVELTIALHREFTSPRDRIVWDVGHQAYVHKLLTGRWEQFATLRQLGGLSGFPRRGESPHDVFETGHASTSISAALGIARARDLLGGRGHVVAVIGDGSLTGGMAFEALNHAGQARIRVIVALNDNSMSISRSVGGLAAYLGRVRTHPLYSRTKADIKNVLEALPGGSGLASALGRLRTGLKYLLIPGVLFEELGWTYLGPVDGHDFQQLASVLGQAKGIQGPVLVHCLTQKGRGYKPAEVNPNRFHGVGPFDRSNGEPAGSAAPPSPGGHGQDPAAGAAAQTFSDAFGAAIVEAAAADNRVCAITAAMPDGTGLAAFMARFPSRAMDVGIAEQHAVTLAAGLAAGGMRPVVAVYSTFLQRAYDQVLHDVCLQELPVVFALDRGGLVGEDGPTHHGAYDLAYLRPMPHITVAAPRDAASLGAMLRLGLGQPGPFALRYPRGRSAPRPLPQRGEIVLGRGELLRDGRDAAILAVGPMVYQALDAAERLAGEGISVAVADCRFVKPLDVELVTGLAKRTGRVVTVEDGVAAGGFGGAVLEALAAAGVSASVRVRVMGLPERPVPHGPAPDLLRSCGLDADGIAAAVRQLAEG